MLTFMWGGDIALILWPNTPCELLDVPTTPTHLQSPLYEASTDGPPPLFLETCDFKQQLLSLPRESAQRGKGPLSMARLRSARLGWAFALFMEIINNGLYENYKIITSILSFECSTGGHLDGSLRLFPFGTRSYRQNRNCLVPGVFFVFIPNFSIFSPRKYKKMQLIFNKKAFFNIFILCQMIFCPTGY